MVRIQYHVLSSILIWAFWSWLYPETGLHALVFLLMADFIIDIDHLYKHKSLKKIEQRYYKDLDYPAHKIWIIFPVAIGAMLTPLFWFGVGLIVHFILDALENIYLFGWRFKWI